MLNCKRGIATYKILTKKINITTKLAYLRQMQLRLTRLHITTSQTSLKRIESLLVIVCKVLDHFPFYTFHVILCLVKLS